MPLARLERATQNLAYLTSLMKIYTKCQCLFQSFDNLYAYSSANFIRLQIGQRKKPVSYILQPRLLAFSSSLGELPQIIVASYKI